MKLEEMPFGEVRKLAEEMKSLGLLEGTTILPVRSHPFKIGEKYFIRTVTQSYTGVLLAVHDSELELGTACWIADSGRFHKALRGEWDSNAEHEPFPSNIVIGRGAIIDACPLSCAIPIEVK